MQEDDLKLLLVLRRQPNLTRAAELLYTTQPTITRRIQQMEKEFQVPILERNNKGVRFTPQGEYLAEQAARLLGFLDDTRTAVRQIQGREFGRIRLATANSYAQYTLPIVLRKYQALHPNIQFDVITAMSDKILPLIKAGEVHAAIVRGEYSYHGIKLLLSRDKCFVFSKQPLTLMDLPFHRMISYPLSANNQALVNNWWSEQFSVPPTESYHVSSLTICCEMVRQGLGYGISLVEDLDPGGQFFHLPLLQKNGAPIQRNTWLLQSDSSREIAVVNDFMEFLAEQR